MLRFQPPMAMMPPSQHGSMLHGRPTWPQAATQSYPSAPGLSIEQQVDAIWANPMLKENLLFQQKRRSLRFTSRLRGRRHLTHGQQLDKHINEACGGSLRLYRKNRMQLFQRTTRAGTISDQSPATSTVCLWCKTQT